MRKISSYRVILLVLIYILSASTISAQNEKGRIKKFIESQENRTAILEGNKLFKDQKYREASKKYKSVLATEPENLVSLYNLGLSDVKQIKNYQDSSSMNKGLIEEAKANFANVASKSKLNAGLAQKAYYNLGNLEYNLKDYAKAIENYKAALRLNPSDNLARKNLRIAQLQQNKNQDNKQNQDNKEKQDQKKDQEQKQNQQNQQNQQKEEPKEQNKISQQAASQILQASDNKENQTRARVNRASRGDKNNNDAYNRKRW